MLPVVVDGIRNLDMCVRTICLRAECANDVERAGRKVRLATEVDEKESRECDKKSSTEDSREDKKTLLRSIGKRLLTFGRD